MQYFTHFSRKEIAAGILIALLFLFASYGSERFAAVLSDYVARGGLGGMAIYMATVMGIILIPFASSLPLVPVAVSLWGNVIAAVLTFSAWVAGGAAAFLLARRFGQPIVERLGLLPYVRKFGDMIPRSNLIFALVIFGLFGMPIDILSYTLGLFTHIRARVYISSFAVGLFPFALFLTYAATLPFAYQPYIMGFMVLAWIFFYSHLKQRSTANGSIRDAHGEFRQIAPMPQAMAASDANKRVGKNGETGGTREAI